MKYVRCFLILLSFLRIGAAVSQEDTVFTYSKYYGSVRIIYNTRDMMYLQTDSIGKASVVKMVNRQRDTILGNLTVKPFMFYKQDYGYNANETFHDVVLSEYQNALQRESQFPGHIAIKTWPKDSAMFIYLNDSLDMPCFGVFYKKSNGYFIKGATKLMQPCGVNFFYMRRMEDLIRSIVLDKLE